MASSSPRSAALFGRRRRSKPGAAPGTLSVGPGALKSALRVLVYDETGVVVDRVLADPGELDELPLGRAGRKLWLDVSGLADLATLRALAARFDLHPLALEDAVHTHQRPKIEAYPKHLFVVLRMLDERDERLGTEQISLFLTDDAVITMQERPGDCFDPVRRRLNDPERLIRRKGPDYLAYALMDAVVDFGFPVLGRIGDRLEELEEAILERPDPDLVAELHHCRRELLVLRRAMWPLREALTGVSRGAQAPGRFLEETKLYLRDTYDHAVQLIELVETYRELSASLLEVYLSSLGQRTNEVMKMLTLVATIFIPLSFLVGLYGMNFDTSSPFNMPELQWRYGYLFALGLMATVAGTLLAWFWRKGWLGR